MVQGKACAARPERQSGATHTKKQQLVLIKTAGGQHDRWGRIRWVMDVVQYIRFSPLSVQQGAKVSGSRTQRNSAQLHLFRASAQGCPFIGCPRRRRPLPVGCRRARLSQLVPLSGTALQGTGLQACGRCPAPLAAHGLACGAGATAQRVGAGEAGGRQRQQSELDTHVAQLSALPAVQQHSSLQN